MSDVTVSDSALGDVVVSDAPFGGVTITDTALGNVTVTDRLSDATSIVLILDSLGRIIYDSSGAPLMDSSA